MVRRIKAKPVLRLRAEGLTGRQIAAQRMSRHSVTAVLDAADREGIGWDDVAELDEAGSTPTRSWTASSTTPSGSRPAT